MIFSPLRGIITVIRWNAPDRERMCFFMRTPYEEERSYYAQGQVESLNEYMTRTFLWMVLG